MKKLLLLLTTLFFYEAISQAQMNSFSTATLSAACTNTNTSCSSIANSQALVNSVGFNVASVTVHGTYTGLTLNFDVSDDGGVTWYADTCTRGDTPIQETSEAVTNSAIRQWDCGVSGTSNFRVRNNAIATGSDIIGITLSVSNIEPSPTVSLSPFTNTTPGALDTTILPTSTSGSAIAPIASTATENGHILKASAGNLYGLVVTSTVNGLVMIFNSTTVPSNGAVTPIYCLRLTPDSNGSGTFGINFLPGPPASFSTGISWAMSTGTNCANLTLSATAWGTGLVK